MGSRASLAQLAAMHGDQDTGDIDFGNSDAGDHDPTEVIRPVCNAWHPSHRQSSVRPLNEPATSIGRQYLASLLALRKAPAPRALRKAKIITCWHDSPQAIRWMVVRMAGLDKSVISKIDRDLSEVEKSKIREAARYMRDEINQLVEL